MQEVPLDAEDLELLEKTGTRCIQRRERPVDAMIREFLEEGGCQTSEEQWLPFGTIGKPDVWECSLFCTQLRNGQVPVTTTDETVMAWETVPREQAAEGLNTLVELSRYRLVTEFSVQMVYP